MGIVSVKRTIPFIHYWRMNTKLIGIMLLLGTMSVNAQKIEFKADINEMSPMSYPARSGLSDFSFEMRNDSAFVHLPYMGEVYNPTYNNEGLNFDAPCVGLTVKPTKKKDGQMIEFSLKHDIVSYRFNVTLWDNNRIDIFMQPSNAQSCNYMGEWEKPQKK